jgi:hypothetical protein
MAFNYSPKIITDSLVLYLDAANTRSYPTTGTIWSDLSRNNNNGTLINGPTFNSSNGGSIVFDGTNDYAAPTNNSFGYSPGTTGNISLELWVYPTGPYTSYINEPPTTNLGGFFGQGYFGASTGWGLGMNRTNSINSFAWQVRNQGTTVTPPNVPYTDNNWYHLIGTFTRNDLSRLYINGVLQSSISSVPLNNISITPSLNNASLGRASGIFYAGCRIGIAKIYNRTLSAQEVLQNYNATKGRFGLT